MHINKHLLLNMPIKDSEEVLFMAQVGEVFTCQLCGNQVTVTKAGGNPVIHCCGQEMTKG